MSAQQYSYEDILNFMLPYERDIYISLIMDDINRMNKEQSNSIEM